MAEFLLKVNDGSDYSDGDVLCAFNRRRIRCCHAQHVCHPWDAPINSKGFLDGGDHIEKFFQHTREFKFQRVSRYEILRTNLITDETSLLSDVPNEYGEAIYVEEFIRRRLNSKARNGAPKLAMFGDIANVIWYGGKTDYSNVKLNLVWNSIETHTPRLESEQEFQLWPMGYYDIRHHLAVRSVDFSDEQAESYISPQLEVDINGDPVWSLIEPQILTIPHDPEKPQTVIDSLDSSYEWQLIKVNDLGGGVIAQLDESEWYWYGTRDYVLSTEKGDDPPDGDIPEGQQWKRIQIAKRNVNWDWRIKLVDNIGVSITNVEDLEFSVGSEIIFPSGKLGYRSKDQPLQSNFSDVIDKNTGVTIVSLP